MDGYGWYLAARHKVAMKKYLNSLRHPTCQQEPCGELVTAAATKAEVIDKTSSLYKDVSSLDKINEYNIVALWGVTDPYLQDALKALLKVAPQCNNDKHAGIQDVVNLLELWKANNA